MNTINRIVPGVSRNDFTDTVWFSVAEAYTRSAMQLHDDETVNSSSWYDISARSALYQSHGDIRLGSLVSIYSKLLICDRSQANFLHFDFQDNAEPLELQYALIQKGITPEIIQADFQSRLERTLGSLGVLAMIEYC